MSWYSVIFVLLFSYISGGYCSELQTVDGKINITIGTTSGCIFVPILMGQVKTTYEKYGKYLNIEYLPWGRTTRAPNGTLICQFGEPDCWSNRVQRCALTLLAGDQEAQLEYMGCEFSDPFPAFRQGSLACTHSAGLNILPVDFCVSTQFGDTLEASFEERSREGMLGINRIPFVVFNNNVDLDIYNQVFLLGLETVVCRALMNDKSTGITSC